MSNLRTILDRLVQENLHGPVDQGNQYSTKYQAIRQAASAAAARKKAEQPYHDSDYPQNYNINRRHSRHGDPDSDLVHARGQQHLDDEPDDEGDLDSRDSRWRQLFHEFFLSENSDDRNDDLLFFVQKPPFESENGGLGVDPVFVKRKVKSPVGAGPQRLLTAEQEAVVLWKDTFFLNVIVQLPCKLTVAVCSRVAEKNPTTGATKFNMTCTQKYVSKRVYALPTKSRVDVKEATVECSWPLIYYVIDDYEDMFEQLLVRDNEYLCVELAVTLPSPQGSGAGLGKGHPTSPTSRHFRGMSHEMHWNSPRGNDGSQVGKPFPSMPGRSGGGSDKITLFQGAAGFSNLLGIYQQKAASKIGRKFKFGPHTVPTEFVMMRGPGGRGHAQVAITASNIGDDPSLATLEGNPSSPLRASVSTSDNLHRQRSEKSLPIVPSMNGHATIGHGIGNGHHRHKNLQPPKIETGSTVPSTPSPTSPQQPSFSARTFFNSLRRISISTLAQANIIAAPPTNDDSDTYDQNYNDKSSRNVGSQPDNLSPSSPTNKYPPNSNGSNNSGSIFDGSSGISASGVGSRLEIEALVKQPQSLKCCMTFVNVPWTGIATLLMDYAYSNSPSSMQ
ncbi:hypothetical protein BGX27_011014 [Mortierella sp. AM989]|nr:hypothetical protein BGX27_011014 [Mortierella sp. AM989]